MKNIFLKFLVLTLSITVIFASVPLNRNNSFRFSADAWEENLADASAEYCPEASTEAPEEGEKAEATTFEYEKDEVTEEVDEASTTNPIYSGTCGDNLTWTLCAGVLTISGIGEMYNWISGNNAPWYSHRRSITTAIINDNVTSIGGGAFSECTSLTSVTIPDSVTIIDDYAFINCSSLARIIIPDSVTSIGYAAFEKCTSLTSVTIPNSVTNIDAYTFFKCISLKTATIPDSIAIIPDVAFGDCTSLERVTILDNVTTIGIYAFGGCTSLVNITIPNSVTNIADHAFVGCASLTNITIPDSVTNIGEQAFALCSSLTNIKIPDGVTSIYQAAFYGCTSLTNIKIPDGVTNIYQAAFYGCTSLTYAIIGNNVTNIANDAFYECDKLADVYYNGTQEQWNEIEIGVNNECLLNAEFYINNYLLSFEGNGAINAIPSKEVKFCFPYGKLPNAHRDDYVLLGWFTKEGTQVDETSIVQIAEDHTLYAEWVESDVASLSVSQLPLKTEYLCSDSFTAEGLEIIVSFVNGSQKTISYEDVEFSNVDLSRPGKKLIKAYYGGKYTTFFVTVKEKDITAIEITTLPNKTTYTIGDDFDATGMELTASYNDSSTKVITSGYTISCNMEAAGTEIVTVSYTENGITVTTDFTITVNEKQADGKPTITASYVTVQAGETVSVPFTVEQNTGFMGFAIEISYDDAVMVPVKVSAGEILSSGNLNDSIGGTVESGTLKVAFFASENVTADGTLFTVEFEIFEDAINQKSKVEIKAVEADCFDENWDTVYFNTSPFEIQIISSVETVPYIAFADAFSDESNKIILPLKLKNMLGVTEFNFELVCDRDVMLPNTVISSGLPDGNVELTQSGKKYYLKWSGTKIVQDEVVLNIYFEASEFASGETDVTVACIIPESIDDIGTVVSINKLLPKTTRLETDLAITSAGDTVRIPICIKHNNGIMGFGLTVEYDDSVLTPISVSRGEILTDGLMDSNISMASDSFKIVWNNTANLTKDGELVVLEFAVASNIDICVSDISFAYSQQDTYNEAWQDVELEIENTAVLIDPIYVVPQSGAIGNNGYVFGLKAGLKNLDGYFETVSDDIAFSIIPSSSRIGSGSVVRVQYNGNTADVYKTILFGDVNGDGWYDAEDAFLVNLIVAGLLTEDKLPAYMWKAADCNHDGLINEIDVDLLMGAGLRKNDIDQNAAQAELVTQTAYIEYASLIDQSAGMYPDNAPIPDMDGIPEDTTIPETNETVEPDGPVSEDHMDFEVIFTNIFEFIKKILSLIFSFII